jgi:hypothetical protein
MTTETPRVLPPNIVAYVIDNQVVQIIHVDERMAAVVLSEPLVIDVTELGKQGVRNGDIYDPETGTFSRPTE